MIGVGLYFINGVKYTVNRSIKSGKSSTKEGERKIKEFNFWGWLLISGGIALGLLTLGGMR
jgi:hypothetical protein